MLETDDRQEALADSMLEDGATIGAIRLRPFTFGSMQAARKLGLATFLGSEEEVSDERAERELVAFGWLQSAPLKEEVLPALRDGTAWDKIDEFAFSLGLEEMEQLGKEVESLGQRVAASAIEIEPKHPDADSGSPPGKS